MTKFLFALVIFLLAVWRVKKGFRNGILQEVVTILSGIVSLVCVALVFLAVSSVLAQATSTLIVCVAALIALGIVYKICNLIFRPILALGNVSVIGGVNRVCGAVLGLAEAFLLAYVLYRMLDFMGIYVI